MEEDLQHGHIWVQEVKMVFFFGESAQPQPFPERQQIQVVPGQAGGGSFKREKDLYSKERICL